MRASPVPLNFRRASAADQVEGALAEAIRQGAWVGSLPGGYELARRLGTSRQSVRTALARLAEAGLITVRNGMRPELMGRSRPPRLRSARTVCVVVPMERGALIHLRATSSLAAAHAAVAEHGIAWEEIFDAGLAGRHPERRLQRLVASRPGVCWILVLATAGMQRWFQGAGVPVLAMGTCYVGVEIPSVDLDYRALGWHAAGRMRQHGHRRTLVVLPDPAMGGDLACRSGFADYMAQGPEPVAVEEIVAGNDPVKLEATLDGLFSRRPHPTAILAMKPANALTVFTHLLSRGLHIPRDVSVISRDSHSLFDFGLSRLTRYGAQTEKEAALVLRMVQSLRAGRALAARPNLLMPEFIAGDTLAPPP